MGDVVSYSPRNHAAVLKCAISEMSAKRSYVRDVDIPERVCAVDELIDVGIGDYDCAGFSHVWNTDKPTGSKRKMFVHQVEYFAGGGDPYAVLVLGAPSAAVKKNFARSSASLLTSVADENSSKAEPVEDAPLRQVEKDIVIDDEYCTLCLEGGELLCCEHPECTRVFHLRCLGVESLPEGVWFSHKEHGNQIQHNALD